MQPPGSIVIGRHQSFGVDSTYKSGPLHCGEGQMSGNDTDGHLHRHASIAAPASFPSIHEGYASFTKLMLGHDAFMDACMV
jgi:hypothetical protein